MSTRPATPYAIYIDDGASVPTLSISGNDARLVGGVRAPNSALSLSGQSDGQYFTTEGAFSVDSFSIGATGALEISNSGHGILATNGFSNQGRLKVSAGVTAQITGNYSQTGDGVYVTGVGVEDGAITHGTLVVSGDVDSNNKLAVDVSDDAGELLAVSEGGDIGIVLTYGGTSVNTGGMAIVDNTSLLDFTAVDDNSGNIELVAVVDEVSYLEQAVEKATGEATGATGERIMAETVPFGGGLTRAETGAQRERKEANKNTLVIQGYDNKARASMDYADLEVDGAGGWSTGFIASYSHTLENDSEFRVNAPYRYTSMADADDTQSHFIGLDVAYLWPLRKGEGWHWDVGGDVFGSAYFLKSDALDLKRSGNVRYGAGLWTSYTTKLSRAPGMVSVGLDTKVSETFSPSSMISTGNENLDREIVDAVAELDPVATVTYGLNYGLPFNRDNAVVNLEVIRSEFISDDIDGDRDAQTRVNLSGSYHISDTFELNAGLYEVYGLKGVKKRGLMLGMLYEF